MNEKDLSAQPNGSGIVDVGAAMAGRNADPHMIKLPNPITGIQIGEEDEEEEKKPAPPVPNLVEHLKGFELPDKLPTCLKESFGLLAKIEALHEDSRVREKAKRELLARIKKHCFDLQQGLPVVNFTADDHDSHEHREAIYLENQIKQLAQTNPPVQRLLEAYEELHDELNETRARLLDTAPQAQAALSQAQQDLSAARESWKSEVSALVSESEKVKAELAAQLAALASVSEENAKLKEQLNALRSQNGAKKK